MAGSRNILKWVWGERIRKKDIFGFFLILLIVFYLFPIAAWLLTRLTGIDGERCLLYLVFPVVVLALGIYIGYYHDICLLFSLAVGGQFMVCGTLFSFRPAWEYALEFLLIGFMSNMATYLFHSTKVKTAQLKDNYHSEEDVKWQQHTQFRI